MKIVRFTYENNHALGIINDDHAITNITAIESSLTDVVTLFKKAQEKNMGPSSYLKELLDGKENVTVHQKADITLLTPVDAPEVWAAGVTYQDSRRARNTETSQKDETTFYDKVYAADRPELFRSEERRVGKE